MDGVCCTVSRINLILFLHYHLTKYSVRRLPSFFVHENGEIIWPIADLDLHHL